jgi:hypothetical protein
LTVPLISHFALISCARSASRAGWASRLPLHSSSLPPFLSDSFIPAMSLASAPTGPSQTSPSKPSNPFARPRAEPTTVKRAALLPSRLAATAENVPVDGSAVASTSADAGSAAGATASPPVRRVALAAGASATPTTSTFAGHGTPGVYATPGTTPGGSGTPRRAPYRLLWRGGLEVGPDGWRLDGELTDSVPS